jgi:hypothetical protein
MVTPEAAGFNTKVYGDLHTKLEYQFDGTKMTLLNGIGVLDQYDYNCETVCNSIFEASSSKMVVLPIVLHDSGGNSWQDTYGRGTSYVVTDRYGKKVYAKGTLCASTTSQTCYFELPYDEKFAIRVDGALDTNGAQHTWTFCGMTGLLFLTLHFISLDLASPYQVAMSTMLHSSPPPLQLKPVGWKRITLSAHIVTVFCILFH